MVRTQLNNVCWQAMKSNNTKPQKQRMELEAPRKLQRRELTKQRRKLSQHICKHRRGTFLVQTVLPH